MADTQQNDKILDAFIDVCKTLALSNGSVDPDMRAAALRMIEDIEPGPSVTAAVLSANLPEAIDYLAAKQTSAAFSARLPARHAYRVITDICRNGGVEAILRYLHLGGDFLMLHGDGLQQSCIAHDCPRRLRLLTAYGARMFQFDEAILSVLKDAGPRLAAALIAQDQEALSSPSLSNIIGDQDICDFTLKQFAFFATGELRDQYNFRSGSLSKYMPCGVIDLVAKMASNHGKLELLKLEPSRAEIACRDELGSFFGLKSPSGLLKDAQ